MLKFLQPIAHGFVVMTKSGRCIENAGTGSGAALYRSASAAETALAAKIGGCSSRYTRFARRVWCEARVVPVVIVENPDYHLGGRGKKSVKVR